jgi:hypothetical protein
VPHTGIELKISNGVDSITGHLAEPDHPARDMPSLAVFVAAPRKERAAIFVFYEQIDIHRWYHLQRKFDSGFREPLVRIGDLKERFGE